MPNYGGTQRGNGAEGGRDGLQETYPGLVAGSGHRCVITGMGLHRADITVDGSGDPVTITR